MRTMQSFLMFFYILDQCFEQCREDDLGGFLGAISPELWEDGLPADRAVITEWEKVSVPKTINEQNIIQKAHDFLTHYENVFGLNFLQTKRWLNMQNGPTAIKIAEKRTREMYQRYDYSN